MELVARPAEQNGVVKPLRILDIGSGGAGYWTKVLQRFGGEVELTLFDPMRPANISELEDLSTVSHFVGLAPHGLSDLPSDSFDLCTAFDLIEHLSKEDGFRLLYEIDRVTKGLSIVFTPNGFVWQSPSSNNPFNAHISGWKPRELSGLGWKKPRGHTGLRCLFGPYGLPRATKKPWIQLSYLTAVLVRPLPHFSFAFSCQRRHAAYVQTRHNGLANEN